MLRKYFKWFCTITAVLLLAFVASSVNMETVQENGTTHKVLTIGTGAYAAGTADYTCDGVADNVQFQAALNALPAGGGEIVVLTGTYVFAATVTRAIGNVTITGTGYSTYFTYDGATALFTAGGNRWTYSNFRVDTTAAALVTAMGATTLWSWENVTTSSGYFAYRTDDATTGSSWNIPTGRGATYVVAASDAPAHVKAQADYVCTGVAVTDAAYINALIVAAPSYGASFYFPAGTYTNIQYVIDREFITFYGDGGDISAAGEDGSGVTIFDYTSAVDAITLSHGGAAKYGGIKIANICINGSAINNAKVGIKTLAQIDQPIISQVFINNYQTGMEINSDAGHIVDCSILFCGTGINGTGSIYDKIVSCEVSDCTSYGIRNAGRVENCTLVRNMTGVYSCNTVINCHVGESDGTPGDGIFKCQIVTGNIVFQNNYAGIKFESQSDFICTGNKVYGSVVYDGIGVYSCTGGVINGNDVATSNRHGIAVETNSTRIIVSNNRLFDNKVSQIDFSVTSDNNIIQGNTLSKNANTPTNGIIVGAGCDSCTITNNDVTASATNVLVNSGSNNVVRSNVGYVTENSGIATLLNGQTTIVVNHGLATTPTAILITWAENPTNVIADWWIDTLTATQFTLNGVDPGASNLDFYWRAVVGAGN